VFPVRKFYIEQMFVLVRIQFHNHVDTQPVKRFERAMRYMRDIKFGMLQVRKSDISLRKCSGNFAHLRGNTGHRKSAPIDSNGSELKSQVRFSSFPKLGKFSSQRKI